VKKEKVVAIEVGSHMETADGQLGDDNIGSASIDLDIEKGKYKLYYMRIEND
jgi:hypothetical protein